MIVYRISDLQILTKAVFDALDNYPKEGRPSRDGELAYKIGSFSISIVPSSPNKLFLSVLVNGTFQSIQEEIPFTKKDSVEMAKEIWFKINNILKRNTEYFFKSIGTELYETSKIASRISGLSFLRGKTKKDTSFTLKKENEDLNKYVMSISFIDSNGVEQKIFQTFNISNVIQAMTMIISFVRISILKYDI